MRLLRAFTVVAAVVLVAAPRLPSPSVLIVLRERAETIRTTARFDPPVLGGQLVPGPCANGGFYARHRETIVLTIAAHCGIADSRLADA